MGLTVGLLRAAVDAVAAGLEERHESLTTLDGQVGDGDLGITLLKAFRELKAQKDALPADLGPAFMAMASAVSKVSSSSFGTLLATALMSAAKKTRGQEDVAWSELSGLLHGAVEAMAARGKASLGDKTVLDAVDAVARAVGGTDDPVAMRTAAVAAVARALDDFRDRPCRIGRARIFGDKTVGMDDPGMVAAQVMVGALTR